MPVAGRSALFANSIGGSWSLINLTVTVVPGLHFPASGIFDRNRILWSQM